MMATNKENAIWKEAVETETSTFKKNKGRRKAPFFKVLQGMPIAIDAFRYGKIPGVTAYFLTWGNSFYPPTDTSISETIDSHAHSDHYTNLSSKWSNSPIYCSRMYGCSRTGHETLTHCAM